MLATEIKSVRSPSVIEISIRCYQKKKKRSPFVTDTTSKSVKILEGFAVVNQ